MAPDVIVGSVVIDVQRAYLDLTRKAQSGELKNGAMKLGLAGGYVDLVLNQGHPAITPQLKQNIVDLRNAVLVGGRKR